MTKSYTISKTKTTRKNEKNSEKEILDKEIPEFLENNYRFSVPKHTQIPNDFLDQIVLLLKECELRVMLFLLRQTFGWHKNWEKITFEDIAKGTGMNKRTCISTIKSLIKKSFVKKRQTGPKNHTENYYSLCIEEDSNNVSECSKNTPGECSKNTPPIYKDIKKVNKEKEDRAPIQASPPPFSQNKKINKDLTEQQRKVLYCSIGKAETDRLDKNAIAHLKKCPKSKYHQMFRSEMIMEFYKKDAAEKAKNSKKVGKKMGIPTQKEAIEQEHVDVYNRIEQRTREAEKNIKDFMKNNPDLAPYMKLNNWKSEVGVQNLVNKQRFDGIEYSKPDYQLKLERWAGEFREANNK